mmetsp:Transcript_36080/g.102142  ORF Transcript_36080/g.102142 Transcript_36080/m.102142 type:complete len:200 (-) Transcript_36080:182-781(-)
MAPSTWARWAPGSEARPRPGSNPSSRASSCRQRSTTTHKAVGNHHIPATATPSLLAIAPSAQTCSHAGGRLLRGEGDPSPSPRAACQGCCPAVPTWGEGPSPKRSALYESKLWMDALSSSLPPGLCWGAVVAVPPLSHTPVKSICVQPQAAAQLRASQPLSKSRPHGRTKELGGTKIRWPSRGPAKPLTDGKQEIWVMN